MSTNTYRSEQTIRYGEPHDVVYYGWHLSGTSDVMDCHPFSSRKGQEVFIEAVGKITAAVDGLDLAPHEIEDLACFIAFDVWGDSGDDRDWGARLIVEYFEGVPDDVIGELCEMAGNFDLSWRGEGSPWLEGGGVGGPSYTRNAGTAVGGEGE